MAESVVCVTKIVEGVREECAGQCKSCVFLRWFALVRYACVCARRSVERGSA